MTHSRNDVVVGHATKMRLVWYHHQWYVPHGASGGMVWYHLSLLGQDHVEMLFYLKQKLNPTLTRRDIDRNRLKKQMIFINTSDAPVCIDPDL